MKKVSSRSLQQTLLLCIGLCFLAPTAWVHHRMDKVASCRHDGTDSSARIIQGGRNGPDSLSSRKVLLQKSTQSSLQEEEASAATAARVHQRRDTVASTSNDNNEDNDSSNYNNVCGDLLSTRSAFSLWMEHITQIHANSRLVQDKGFRLHDLTVQVLQLFTPQLPLSVRTVTRNPAVHLQALFHKTKRRYDYLVQQQHDQQQSSSSTASQTQRRTLSKTPPPPPPPPVKIVVLGGSVTAGVNCISGVGNANLGACAWPARLETLVNGMVHDMIVMMAAGASAANSTAKQQRQQPLIEVHVFAIGGSNTQTATTLLEYDLLPQQAKNPDIIINAFSTNDMHVDTVKMATSQEKKLPDLVFDMMQDFVRVVLRPPRSHGHCPSSAAAEQQQHPPVLLWLDDYLGNEQRLIMETTAVSKAMHLLSNYYGFASISYADAIRDVVYGDTHEQLFSPNWYKGGRGKKKKGAGDGFLREIHPGQGMHMATAWTVAYNLLHLATHYCSLQQIPKQGSDEQPATNDSSDFAPWPGLPSLRQAKKQIGSSIANAKPGPTPDTLPPPLTDTLNLRRVSIDWQESHQAFQEEAHTAVANANNQHDRECNNQEYKQCPFSWIVGLPVDGRNVDLFHERESNAEMDMREIHAYFVQHATVSDLGGWQVQDDTKRKKYGWVPPPAASTTEPTMTLEFWNMTQPIRAVTLFTMKSYGEKWANSTVQVTVSTADTRELGRGKDNINKEDHWKTAASKILFGFHDMHTSEMYTEPIVLPHAVQPGQAIRIAITLIGGATFKIQGMAVCS